MARERHYEFSSLRRAKFSSMSMLYELHNQGQDKFVYTCNNCKGHVETRYHCTVCDDFDLCIQCYDKDGHPHKMEKLGLDLDDGSSPADPKQANPQVARKLSIQRCIQSLVHACQCRDANCRLPSCQKMKRVVTHTKVCKRKTNGGCPICKQLIALCCYHAKHCQETKCLVPFCSNIKHKLKQQQLQQRLQQAHLLRRRMAVMRTVQPGLPVASGTGPSGTPCAGATSPASTVSSPSGGLVSPHQPGVGLKPGGTQTPPANVLQVVKQVQEEAARQQAPHVTGYGKAGPGGQVMPPPSQMARNPMASTAGTNLLPIEQWTTPRYPNAGIQNIRQPNVGQHQQMQPQQPQVLPGVGINPHMGLRQGLQGAPPPGGGALHKQALQQLMQTLKSPNSPEQQAQILQILKSNPQLMAAFIKQRQAQTAAQQGANANAGGGGPTGAGPGTQQSQIQQIMSQQAAQAQVAGRMQHLQQAMINQQGGGIPQQQQPGGPGQVGPGNQQMQWYKQQQQQHQLLLMRQQQQQHQQAAQQGQFQQPPAPPYQQQRLPGGIPRQPLQQQWGSGGFTGEQTGGYLPGAGHKPAPPTMGPPAGSVQQLMQSVRSPPPIRSPQPPNPSPRPVPSPRGQPAPSPRGHELPGPSEMMLSNSAAAPSGDQQDQTPSTMTDQLSKFVEQL